MKLRALALIGALTIASPVLAQDPTPPGPGGQQEGGRRGRGFGGRGGPGLNIDQLKEELGLTPEQVAEAEKIAEEMRTKMREAFESGDREGMRDRMRAMFEESFTRLEEKLTPEQKEKFKAYREQMEQRRAQFGRGRGEGGPGGPGGRRGGERLREEALSALALQGEDAAVITPLLDAVLQGREAARGDAETARRQLQEKVRETTDPEAIGKLLSDYRAAREAARATALQTQDQLREVLTVEQEAKLVALGVLD